MPDSVTFTMKIYLMRFRPAIKYWLYIGVIMVFVQILLGGITRLTGSGLSITKWEIVTGTLPPLTSQAWDQEFDLYKETPQYEKINEGMSLSEFKFIYFWEYFHRLWARLLGFVFLFPFLFFLSKGFIDKQLMKHLLLAVLFGGLVGFFGWIMVASGLVDRPWVNAYKLMLHLGLAVLLFCFMVHVTVQYKKRQVPINAGITISKASLWRLCVFIFLQILLGALMSGMKAGLFFPTWPSMNGTYWPEVLRVAENWSLSAFLEYDKNAFMPAIVQILHRGMAYGLLIGYAITLFKHPQKSLFIGFGILLIQVVLGVLTLINCIGQIPLMLGILHQLIGILLLGHAVSMLSRKY